MTETQGMIAGLFLLFALLVYTFWPENVFASQREKTRLDFLLERKEQLYENLRDLNFEYRAGKYPEEDFQVQRAQLENETAQLLAEIDHLQQADVKAVILSNTASRRRFLLLHDPRTSKTTMKSTQISSSHFCFQPSICGRTGTGRNCIRHSNRQDHRQARRGRHVVLVDVQAGMGEVAHATTDAHGQYTLTSPATAPT